MMARGKKSSSGTPCGESMICVAVTVEGKRRSISNPLASLITTLAKQEYSPMATLGILVEGPVNNLWSPGERLTEPSKTG
jgi:hypothetical protein